MNLNLLVVSIFIAILPFNSGLSATNDPVQLPEPITADELMQTVIARLPSEPLVINGEMVIRKRRGVVVAKMGFEILANWGSNPARATYIINDAFGSSLESMTLVRVAGKNARVEYARGSPLIVAVPPSLSDNVQGSDLTWLDLTFAFLWWKDGKIVGRDKLKGRDCFVVEIPAPQRGQKIGEKKEREPYSKVVLWIDREIRVLMQAEGYSADGDLLRKLWVRSFKKIDGRWMVKDLEVQQYPDLHRTKLTVQDVKEKQ